ncbi:MAG: mandelate racemase/muconate lactonizing enzyme family protein [Actinomycetota bacterium]
MKITEIRVYRHTIEVAGGLYQMSISEVTALDTTVLVVETDAGIVGYGETCPLGSAYQPQHALGARAAIAEVAPTVIGLDPRDHRLVNQAMDSILNGHGYAKSPLDVACWDIAAKAADQRLCDFLGGAHQDPIPSYYGIMPAETSAAAAHAVELQAAGFGRLQVKTGGRPVSEDIAVMQAVAEVAGPAVKLLADANRGWTQRDAMLFSGACRDIPLALEQPCATFEENAALAGRVNHPVFLDESADSVSSVMRAIHGGAAQGFGMKLSRVGGISKMNTVIGMCAARSIPLTSDDTWGGDITNAATVHVGASIPEAIFEGTWIGEPYTATAYPMRSETITNRTGHIAVPDGPGLGVTPDLDAWGEPVAVYR